jgi:hypothetical protein
MLKCHLGRVFVRGLFVSAVITIVVGSLAVRFGVDDWLSGRKEVNAQLDEIRHKIAAGQRFRAKVLDHQPNLDLHGTGTKSHLMVIGEDLLAPSQPNDVRIYDVVDDELQLRFRLWPEGKKVGKPLWNFQFTKIIDVDRDGTNEIVGMYHSLDSGDFKKYPVLIAWDDASSEYRISPLFSDKPSAKGISDHYSAGMRLPRPEVGSRHAFPAYSVAAYDIITYKDGEGTRNLAIAAHYTHTDPFDEGPPYVVTAFGLGEPFLGWCTKSIMIKHRDPEVPLSLTIVDAWRDNPVC